MPTSVQLVVGLGNPGAEYAQTRHNAGFWFCDRISTHCRAHFLDAPRFRARMAKLPAAPGQPTLWMSLPQAFMNCSGEVVQAITHFYRIPCAAILVVHDDLDLLPGQIRLKWGGGSGGHNGLKDITRALGTPDYWRLRIGIGHPGQRADVVHYVLHRPTQDEGILIDTALDRGLATWPLLQEGQFEAAMRVLHVRQESVPAKQGGVAP